MAEIKIAADSGGGTVSIKGPSTTGSNAAREFTLPDTYSGNGSLVTADSSNNVKISGGAFIGSANQSKTQDGIIIERNTGDGYAHITAGRSGGNYSGLYTYVAGADGVTKKFTIDPDGTYKFFAQDGSTERLRIASNGYAYMGTTSTAPNPGFWFNPTGGQLGIGNNDGVNTQSFIEFRRNTTQIGSVTQSGTTGVSFNTSSDYRLKENQVAISDGITRLKTLKPYRFNFKAEPSITVDGFFAHEVTAVPEAIVGTKDKVDEDDKPIYQQIDQSKLVPLLTASLQEAIGKIEVLETKVAALEAK